MKLPAKYHIFMYKMKRKFRLKKKEIKQALCRHKNEKKRMEWSGLHLDCADCGKYIGCIMPARTSAMTVAENDENVRRCGEWYAGHVSKGHDPLQ